MSQPIEIYIGAIPNDGTGDPLRTAFNDVNLNFANVWATGIVGNNIQIANTTISTINTNGNLVLAPNGTGVVQSNVSILPNTANLRNLGSATRRWSTVYTQYLNATQINLSGDLTVSGNLTVMGNVVNMGNIVTDTLAIQLANTTTTANAANGAGVTVGANDDIATLLYSSAGNVWTMNIGLNTPNLVVNNISSDDSTFVTIQDGLDVQGDITAETVSATGNITGNYIFGNGSQLTGLPDPYGNSNVATFLANFGSNTVSTTGTITAGNIGITGGRLGWANASIVQTSTSDFSITSDGQVSVRSLDGTYQWTFDSNGNLTAPGNIGTSANITGNYFFGNGSQLTGITSYANTDAVAYGESGWAGNIIPSGNAVYSLGNSTNQWSDLYVSNATIYMNNVPISLTAGNVLTVDGVDVVTTNANGQANIGNLDILGTTISVAADAPETYINLSASVEGWAYVQVPTDATANVYNTRIHNDAGNIEFGTGDYSTGETNYIWTLDNTGNLNFPDNSGSSWPIASQRFGMGNIGAWLDGQWTIGEFSGNGVSGQVGIRIDPGIEGNTGITLPSQADSTTQPVSIYNTGGGGIELYTGANNWEFNADGSVIFPTLTVDLHNGGNQSGQVLQFGDPSRQAIITGPTPAVDTNAQRLIIQGQAGNGTGEGGDVYLWAGDAQNNGGDIKIYAGDADAGNVGDLGGYVNIDGGAGFTRGGQVEITGGYSSSGDGGYVNLNGGYGNTGGNVGIQAGYGQAGPGGAVTIQGGASNNGLAEYGNVGISAGASSWAFDNTGNLTLPQAGVVYETNIPFGGLSGKTIALKPSGGIDADQQLLVYPTAGPDANHLHLTSGNLYNTELFLGNDNLYVKLANTGNIVINSNDDTGNTAQWTFGTDGVATLPGEGVLQSINDTVTLRSLNTSTGNANSVYLGTSGGLGFNDQEIGGNWLEIFRNGTEPEIRVPVGLGNLNIQTASGNTPYNWTFNNTGSLTLPGGSRLRPLGANLDIFAGTGSYVNLITSDESSYMGVGGAGGYVVTAGGTWDFNTNGNLTAPGNVSAVGNITGGNIITSGSGGDITMSGGNITGANVVTANVVNSSVSTNISNVTINSYTSVPQLWFRGQLSAAQNVTTTTDTVTIWNNNSDPLGWGNVSTGHIVPNKAGWYEVTSRVQFNTNAAANSQNQINHQIAVNGNQAAISQSPNFTGNVPLTMISTAMVELNGTTDYITTTSWSAIAGNAQQINGGNTSMVLVRWISN
jgi:cytoskeletal protein CcmA (bactofilin family)